MTTGNRKIYRENKDGGQDYLNFDSQAGAEKARVPVEEIGNSKFLHKKKRNPSKFSTFFSDVCCELCN
jgi:hypothetical protein